MRIAMESTEVIAEINGVHVWIWKGLTEGRYPVEICVHQIATEDPAARAELERLGYEPYAGEKIVVDDRPGGGG